MTFDNANTGVDMQPVETSMNNTHNSDEVIDVAEALRDASQPQAVKPCSGFKPVLRMATRKRGGCFC